MGTNKKERYGWKDVSSAVVIFCVWVAHLGTRTGLLSGYWGEIINPCFFMLVGLFAFNASKYSFKEFVVRNVRRLLIPYLGWIIINVLFQFLLYEWRWRDVIKGIWMFVKLEVGLMPFGAPLWFLMGIFICKIVYEIIRRMIRNVYVISIICFMITMLIEGIVKVGYSALRTGYVLAIYYMFYYSLGVVLLPVFDSMYKMIHTEERKRARVLLCVGVVIMLVIDAFIFFVGFKNIVWIGEPLFKHMLLTYMSVNLLILTLFIRSSELEYIGQNTIVFCGMETIMKTTVPLILGMVNINLNLNNGISCMLYVGCLFGIMRRLIVPIVKKVFPYLEGR